MPPPRLHALCALMLMLPGSVGASLSQTPTIKEDVRQVLVPVVVTDHRGHPVSNLKQSDFAVFEDESPQTIVAFSSTYESAFEAPVAPVFSAAAGLRTRAATRAAAIPDSPTRTYLVCVDMLHSTLASIANARAALAKFFAHEQDPRAQYALMSLGREIDVVQDSTRDPSLVLAALKSKKFQSSMLSSEASSLAFESAQLRGMLAYFDPASCTAPTIRIRGSIQDNCSGMKREVQIFINRSAERTALLTRAYLNELKSIITASASMPTQKTIVLISDGFNLVPGKELFGIASAFFPDSSEWRLNERDTQPELNELLRLAQRSNVVVYTLDSRGVYNANATGMGDAQYDSYMQSPQAMTTTMNNERSIGWENGSALAQLASATGGIFFYGNNDLLAGIRRAFDDERERYLLAYNPSNHASDGKYRKIRVVVKDKSLHAYAKAGYWAIGP